MKSICNILLALFLFISPAAYTQNFSEVMKEVSGVQHAYQASGYLSYQMKYLFSQTDDPARYIDSLAGSFKMHDSSFSGSIGTIEFLQNTSSNIFVNSQDSLITINKPAKHDDKLIPLVNWDSLFIVNNVDTVILSDVGNVRTLEFIFSPLAVYKNFVLVYNPQTYLLQKLVISYHELLVTTVPGMQMKEGNIMTIVFSNYSIAVFGDNIFSEERYVLVHQEPLSAPSPYNSFRVVDRR